MTKEEVTLELFSQMNYADLSPNYSGFLMSISNTVGSIPGFVAPLVTGIITEDNASSSQTLIKLPSIINHNSQLQSTIAAWRSIFLIAAGIYIFSSIIFMVFGTDKVQQYDAYANIKVKLTEPKSEKQNFLNRKLLS